MGLPGDRRREDRRRRAPSWSSSGSISGSSSSPSPEEARAEVVQVRSPPLDDGTDSKRTWHLCWLLFFQWLVLVCAFLVPDCTGSVAWSVVSRELLTVELVCVTLLVVVTVCIVMLVERKVHLMTEFIVVVTLALLNVSIIHVVSCYSLVYGRSLWLTVLVIPLCLLTMKQIKT